MGEFLCSLNAALPLGGGMSHLQPAAHTKRFNWYSDWAGCPLLTTGRPDMPVGPHLAKGLKCWTFQSEPECHLALCLLGGLVFWGGVGAFRAGAESSALLAFLLIYLTVFQRRTWKSPTGRRQRRFERFSISCQTETLGFIPFSWLFFVVVHRNFFFIFFLQHLHPGLFLNHMLFAERSIRTVDVWPYWPLVSRAASPAETACVLDHCVNPSAFSMPPAPPKPFIWHSIVNRFLKEQKKLLPGRSTFWYTDSVVILFYCKEEKKRKMLWFKIIMI